MILYFFFINQSIICIVSFWKLYFHHCRKCKNIIASNVVPRLSLSTRIQHFRTVTLLTAARACTGALLQGLLISRLSVVGNIGRKAGRHYHLVRVREGEFPPHEVSMATPTRPATASCPACFHVLPTWRRLTSQTLQPTTITRLYPWFFVLSYPSWRKRFAADKVYRFLVDSEFVLVRVMKPYRPFNILKTFAIYKHQNYSLSLLKNKKQRWPYYELFGTYLLIWT